MFVGIHAMLAMQTGTPELAISEEEGHAFMSSAQNVMRHYSVETTQKTLDWISFIGCTVTIYGTRVVAISARRSGDQTKPARGRGKVVPLRPGQAAEAGAVIEPDWSVQPADAHGQDDAG